MQISKKERLELNALSKEIFGTSSRWQKLVDNGYTELVTEEKTETVPPAKEGDEPTTHTIRVPVLTEFGAKQSVTKRHTVESVKESMLEQKKRLEELREKIRQHQEKMKEAREAALKAKLAIEESAGSAKE